MTAENPADTPPAEVPAPAANGARFLGDERTFWRLLRRGAVLLLVTLGIYRFWLATDVRRSLWNHTEIAGDHLEYIGPRANFWSASSSRSCCWCRSISCCSSTTLSSGVLGQIAGALTLVVLGLLGQFAVYRARRYRLTRTLYRGIRFHQSGAAWRYAICAVFWWTMIVLTLGLAYPWAQASLERFKLHNTHYGDLQGEFVGSGTRLFFRGVLFWIVVVGPFVLGLVLAIGRRRLGRARRDGPARWRRSHEPDPGCRSGAWRWRSVGLQWSLIAVALLYPAFQAMVHALVVFRIALRRLDGDVPALDPCGLSSLWTLRWQALPAAVVLGVVGVHRCAIIGVLETRLGKSTLTRIAADRDPDSNLCDCCARLFHHLPGDGEVRLWTTASSRSSLPAPRCWSGVKAAGASGSAVGGARRRAECRRDLKMRFPVEEFFSTARPARAAPCWSSLRLTTSWSATREPRHLARWSYG